MTKVFAIEVPEDDTCYGTHLGVVSSLEEAIDAVMWVEQNSLVSGGASYTEEDTGFLSTIINSELHPFVVTNREWTGVTMKYAEVWSARKPDEYDLISFVKLFVGKPTVEQDGIHSWRCWSVDEEQAIQLAKG